MIAIDNLLLTGLTEPPCPWFPPVDPGELDDEDEDEEEEDINEAIWFEEEEGAGEDKR